MKRSIFYVLFSLISLTNYSQIDIGFSSNTIIKDKTKVFYYPEVICTYNPLTTQDIIAKGPYNKVFEKIDPKFFVTVDSLFLNKRKAKINSWTPCTVLGVWTKDTCLYFTFDSKGNYIRSDEINKTDSVYYLNTNTLLLMEDNVKGFKKYRNKEYFGKGIKNK